MAVHVAGSTPYPWPWNGVLTGAGTAVVVVLPGGVAPALGPSVLAGIRAVATAVRRSGGLVVLLGTRRPGRATGPIGTPVGIDPELISDHVAADGIDGFFGSRLDGLLRAESVERLILVGAGLETCVHSTMRSANDRGYECLLVADAVAAHDPDLAPASMSMIEMSGGIFGAVARTDAVTAAFEGEAA